MARVDFKNFKPIAQDEHSYTIEHPNGARLFIEKAKLSPEAHKQILHLYQGGVSDGASPNSTFQNQVDNQRVSDLGGGDPMASFKAQPQASVPSTSPTDGDAAPDAELDPSEFGPVSKKFTRQGPLVSAKDKAGMDAIKAKEGPVSGDDGSGGASPAAVDQAVAQEASAVKGRELDAAASSDPLLAQKMGMGDLLQQQVGEQQQALDESQAAGKQIAGVQDEEAQRLGALPSYNDIVAKYQAKDGQLAKDYMDAKVDPEHFLHSMGTGSKIVTGIGMILSGMGSATTGQPSYAMQVVNDAIQRDIEAQKQGQGQKLNLWKMNREMMGSEAQANLATENQIKAGVLAKLQAAQTRAVLPQEKLRAQQAIDQLKGEMLQNNLRRGLLTQGTQAAQASGGSALSSADPAMLVPEMVKDPAQQKAVYDEIKGRQNIARNGQKMLEAFDQAAKDTSGVVGRPLSLAYEPGSVIQLKQLMLPNFDKIDSTVRQATMDASYKDIIPSATDTDDRKAKKRAALMDWMNSNLAAPISKGNYIDLDRFQNTAPPRFLAPKQSAPPPAQTVDRVTKDGKIAVFDAKTKKFLRYK